MGVSAFSLVCPLKECSPINIRCDACRSEGAFGKYNGYNCLWYIQLELLASC